MSQERLCQHSHLHKVDDMNASSRINSIEEWKQEANTSTSTSMGYVLYVCASALKTENKMNQF